MVLLMYTVLPSAEWWSTLLLSQASDIVSEQGFSSGLRSGLEDSLPAGSLSKTLRGERASVF